MSGFVAYPDNPSAEGGNACSTIELDGWFPAVDLAHFRETQRIGEAVTDPRLAEAVRTAMITVLVELRSWKARHVAAGAVSLEAVEAEQVDFESFFAAAYRRAVYSYALAELAETHRDVTVTGDGAELADRKGLTADDHRRNGIHAIRDILGVSRIDAELI